MKTSVMCLALTLVLCLVEAAGLSSESEGSPASQSPRIAFGALRELHPADSFVYKIRFPKRGFVGSPHPSGVPDTHMPRTEDHYETRWFRLVVLSATPVEKAPEVRLRMDSMDNAGDPLARGVSYIRLRMAADGRRQADFYNASLWKEVHTTVGSPRDIPVVFDAYPDVEFVPGATGSSVVAWQEPMPNAYSWAFRDDPLDRSVLVNADAFEIISLASYHKMRMSRRLRAKFLDVQEGRFMASPPSLERAHRREAFVMMPGPKEVQTWDYGAPLWKHMIRHDRRGGFLFECTLLRRERIGAAEVEAANPPAEAFGE